MMTVLYLGTTCCLHPKPHTAYQPLVFCLVLASKIPWTEGPGRLQSIGPQRIGHDWMTFTFSFPFYMRLWVTCLRASEGLKVPGSKK